MDSFPWWPEGLNPLDNQVEEAFHSSVQLGSGRQGLLVDIGAWTNLIGSNQALSLTRKALDNGLTPQQTRMPRPEASENQGSRPRHSGREVDGQTADRGA